MFVSHIAILDIFVPINKTLMSRSYEYPGAMKNVREKLSDALKGIIGEGKQFRSARELAQRAHTLGYVDNAESFARQISRARNGEHDPQIGTIDIISRAAGVKLTDFLEGNAQPLDTVNPPNKAHEPPLSGQSEEEKGAILTAQSLTRASKEMRELVDHLIKLDQMGGAEREMAIAGIRYILRGSHIISTSPKKK